MLSKIQCNRIKNDLSQLVAKHIAFEKIGSKRGILNTKFYIYVMDQFNRNLMK